MLAVPMRGSPNLVQFTTRSLGPSRGDFVRNRIGGHHDDHSTYFPKYPFRCC
ncbi:hypothetical protein VCR14J2_260409 [Vibrio coralliirubri]|nr:hypothetical protein VCR14J2_260409 [Vibrio coralliirubri]